MQITIVMGNGCNMACKYCFEKNKTGLSQIGVEDAEKLFKAVYSEDNPMHLKKDDEEVIGFTGGEPLLYLDNLEKIVELFLKSLDSFGCTGKRHIFIVSNGTMINTPKVQAFLKKYADITEIAYSIDGKKETHDKNRVNKSGEGTYDLVYDNFMNHTPTRYKTARWTLGVNTIDSLNDVLQEWITYNIPHVIQLNKSDNDVLTDNYILGEQLDKLINWYTNQDVDWVLSHEVNVANANYTSQFMAEAIEDMTCPGNQICLDFDGSILKCIHSSDVACKRQNSYIYGTVHDIENVDWKKLRKTWSAKDGRCSYRDPECYRCPIGVYCGKCDIYNFNLTGDAHKWSKSYCNIYAFHHLLKVFFNNFWIKLYKQYAKEVKVKTTITGINLYNDSIFMHVVDILIPKVWALEFISEDTYNYLVNLTESVGGNVNPLETKLYSEEQVKEVQEYLISLKQNIQNLNTVEV